MCDSLCLGGGVTKDKEISSINCGKNLHTLFSFCFAIKAFFLTMNVHKWEHNADMGAVDNDGSTPLHIAIYEASLGAVQVLPKHGSYINVQNRRGQTALHRASQCG